MVNDDAEEFDNKPEIPIEALSPESRVKISSFDIRKGLYEDLVDIAKAEDMSIRAVVRRALTKFVRGYKENGSF